MSTGPLSYVYLSKVTGDVINCSLTYCLIDSHCISTDNKICVYASAVIIDEISVSVYSKVYLTVFNTIFLSFKLFLKISHVKYHNYSKDLIIILRPKIQYNKRVK